MNPFRGHGWFAIISLSGAITAQLAPPTQAEIMAQVRPPDPRGGQPPSLEPLPTPNIQPLPPPDQLLPPTPGTPPVTPPPGDAPQTLQVTGFNVVGSTVFSAQDFNRVITEAIGEITAGGRLLSLNELFQVRTAITDLYVSKGYITSGAFIPPQKLTGGVVEIRVVEGSLEDIRITGTNKLKPGYVSSRLALATKAPLNRDRLLEALQLLQLNPLIASISAELSAGAQPGTSVLEVRVTEAKSTFATFTIDNQRVPSVGSVRGQALGVEQNLLGFGDAISLAFTQTQGSTALDFTYSIPVSPRNTTVGFNAGVSISKVIEAPFSILDIESGANYFEVIGRHPIILTPTRELAVGLVFGRRSSKTSLLGDIPFPSPGADLEGRTTSSVVRFFQEYTQRSSQAVFAARSQFNLGVEALNATTNPAPPDTNFFVWRFQTQWVRLLAPDTLLLLRGDVQLADRVLLPIEQFGLGGALTVRGYRQDLLLTDNGLFGSVEGRIPILRLPQQKALLQAAPFFDFGRGWNLGNSPEPDPSFLASLGFGLRLQVSNNFTARMDFGFPLRPVNGNKDTLQEKGIYFSIIYTPF